MSRRKWWNSSCIGAARYERRRSHVLREKKRHGEPSKREEVPEEKEPAAAASTPRVATVLPARDSAPSPALVLPLSASPCISPRSEANMSSRSEAATISKARSGDLLPSTAPAASAPVTARSRADSQSRGQDTVARSASRPSLPSPRATSQAEDRLDTLIKSLQKGEEQSTGTKASPERQGQVPNNQVRLVVGGQGGEDHSQAPVLPARPLPAEAVYKNNLLKVGSLAVQR